MDQDIQDFGEMLGRNILTRNWSTVHQHLAPWLQASTSVAEVEHFFEKAYRSILEENGIQTLHYPEHPEPSVSGNTLINATGLREPIGFLDGKVRTVPSELTDQNMRYWMKLELHCSDEQMDALDFDTFCELWIAVVTSPEGLRVGYWSHGAY